MKHRKLIIGGAVGLAVIAVVLWLVFGGSRLGQETEQQVSTDDSISVVLEFYESWLAAKLSTSTDPYKSGLAKEPILSKELRARIADAKGQPETELDPVLCQTTILPGISTRIIYEREDSAQILVASKHKEITNQAVVTLLRLRGGWYINDITCSLGEFAPPQEFSFDQEGYLLKSVVAPMDSRYWHLVFEQNNEKGHFAPLFFSPESTCKDLKGNTSVCNPDQFVEPMKALVRGELTETGVNVKRVEMLR